MVSRYFTTEEYEVRWVKLRDERDWHHEAAEMWALTQ